MLNKIVFECKQTIHLCCLKTINATPRGFLSSYVICPVCNNYIIPEKSCKMIKEKNLKLLDDSKGNDLELAGFLFNKEIYTEARALAFTQKLFAISGVSTCAVSVYDSGGLLRISKAFSGDNFDYGRVCLMATGVLGIFTHSLCEAV